MISFFNILLEEMYFDNNAIIGEMPKEVCNLREMKLKDLYADCGGALPQLQCAKPSCCTGCY